MAYGILTFLITLVMTLLTFLYDFKKNIEFRKEAFYLVHEDVLSTSLSLETDFKYNYPEFYKVIKTFEGKDFRKISSNLNSIQKVPNNKLDYLKSDMKKIVESGSERDKLILNWYFVTCSLVEDLKHSKHRVFKEESVINIDSQKTAKLPDVDKLNSGVCYA